MAIKNPNNNSSCKTEIYGKIKAINTNINQKFVPVALASVARLSPASFFLVYSQPQLEPASRFVVGRVRELENSK
jgi:hypothetical protein